MPPKPKRPCKSPRCPNLTNHHLGYCDKHKAQAFDRLRATATKDKIAEKDGFYNSSTWRAIRREFLLLNPFCCKCNDVATTADHILARRFYPQLALEFSNLQPLCNTCHSRKTGREIRARQLDRHTEDY